MGGHKVGRRSKAIEGFTANASSRYKDKWNEGEGGARGVMDSFRVVSSKVEHGKGTNVRSRYIVGALVIIAERMVAHSSFGIPSAKQLWSNPQLHSCGVDMDI